MKDEGFVGPHRRRIRVYSLTDLDLDCPSNEAQIRSETQMQRAVERLLLLGGILCIASPSSAQQESLIVMARANGGTAGVAVDVCGPLSTVESISGPSSLIV